MKNFIMFLTISFMSVFSFAGDFKESLTSIFPESVISEVKPSSKAVKELYLAKDKDSRIVGGAAVRVFKSYKKVTAFLVIKKENSSFKVVKAEIPDAEKIGKDEYIAKVKSVAADFQDKVLKKESSDIIKVDATAEATKYHKKAYLTFNLLADHIIAEIEKNS